MPPPQTRHTPLRRGTVQASSVRSAAPAFGALALGVLAFAVRVQGLGAQSLWHDEGATLYYASLDPLAMVEQVAALGEIPPFYYLLLHFWLGAAGTGEFALRFPSAGFGALAVPLVFVLGRRLGGNTTGLAAAAFLTLSPLHVWQSQEARMYALVVVLSLASVYLFARLLERAEPRLVVACAAVGAAGLYTHFTFALVLIAQGFCLALWLPFARPGLRNALAAAAGSGLAVAAFLPWLRVGLLTYATGTTYWPGRLDVATAARDTLAAFVQGTSAKTVEPATLATATAVLAALGIAIAALRQRQARGVPAARLLLCYLVVPAAVLFWLLLDRPKYGPRYLLVSLPAFALAAGWATAEWAALFARRAGKGAATSSCLLDEGRREWNKAQDVGAGLIPGRTEGSAVAENRAGAEHARNGLASGGRAVLLQGAISPVRPAGIRLMLAGGLGAAGLALGLWTLGISALTLPLQSDPKFAREDFRGLAAYVAEQAGADDAVILLGGHIQLPFLHYYRSAPRPGVAPVFPLPDTLMPAVANPIQADDLAVLNQIVPGRRRVWVVRWQDELADPAGMIGRQLELAGRRVDPGRAFHGLHLEAFAVQGNPRFPLVFAPRVALEATFADSLTLLGYDLSPERPRPGDILALTLYWRVDARPPGDLIAFSQLLNAGDHIYAQHDKPPVSELYKTSQWTPGDLLKDEYRLRVRPGSPPGRYRLQIGLYDRATMQRAPVRTQPGVPPDTRLLIAEVVVEPGPPAGASADSVRHPLALDLAPGMRLLGYEVEQDTLHPGDTARVALLWHATGAVEGERMVYLALRDAKGREVARTVAPPADGTYSTSRWRADDLVRDVQNFKLGPDLVPGVYELLVAAPPAGVDSATPVAIGTLEIR